MDKAATMLVKAIFLQKLHELNILLKLNGGPPQNSKYGWLSEYSNTITKDFIKIEENSGLYGGKYIPSLGGQRTSGLFSIGSFSYSYSALHEEVKVGRYCSLSNGITILDSYHPMGLLTTSVISFRPNNKLVSKYVPLSVKKEYPFNTKGDKNYPVIEHDVWIGRDVTLAMGVTIGIGSVVAARSVVTKNVPPYAVVAGNPARIVKYRFSSKVINDLLSTQWWKYNPDILIQAGLSDLEDFKERLQYVIKDKDNIYAKKEIIISCDDFYIN